MTEQLDPTLLSNRDQALLVQLADDTLPARSRARADRRVGAIPDAARLIERQRRVARALAAGEERTAVLPARATHDRRRVPRALMRLAPAGALAVVLMLAVAGGPSGDEPTLARAADLAKAPATRAAPADAGPVLRASVDGVPFPDWGAKLHWRATGMRRDVLDGRRTTTVFYEHTSHRLAYTIVSGPPLPRPAGAQVVRRGGREIALYRDPGHGGHDVAVFERGGRTCVVAGHVMNRSTLVDLAVWPGPGSRRA